LKEDFFHITEMEYSQIDKFLQSDDHPYLQNKWKIEQDSKSMWEMFKILSIIMSFIFVLMYYIGVFLIKYDGNDF